MLLSEVNLKNTNSNLLPDFGYVQGEDSTNVEELPLQISNCSITECDFSMLLTAPLLIRKLLFGNLATALYSKSTRAAALLIGNLV
jgi:hypothetical protein